MCSCGLLEQGFGVGWVGEGEGRVELGREWVEQPQEWGDGTWTPNTRVLTSALANIQCRFEHIHCRPVAYLRGGRQMFPSPEETQAWCHGACRMQVLLPTWALGSSGLDFWSFAIWGDIKKWYPSPHFPKWLYLLPASHLPLPLRTTCYLLKINADGVRWLSPSHHGYVPSKKCYFIYCGFLWHLTF